MYVNFQAFLIKKCSFRVYIIDIIDSLNIVIA